MRVSARPALLRPGAWAWLARALTRDHLPWLGRYLRGPLAALGQAAVDHCSRTGKALSSNPPSLRSASGHPASVLPRATRLAPEKANARSSFAQEAKK